MVEEKEKPFGQKRRFQYLLIRYRAFLFKRERRHLSSRKIKQCHSDAAPQLGDPVVLRMTTCWNAITSIILDNRPCSDPNLYHGLPEKTRRMKKGRRSRLRHSHRNPDGLSQRDTTSSSNNNNNHNNSRVFEGGYSPHSPTNRNSRLGLIGYSDEQHQDDRPHTKHLPSQTRLEREGRAV